MKIRIHVRGADNKTLPDAAGFEVATEGDFAVITGPGGIKGRVRSNGLVDFNVSIATKTIIANYANKDNALNCCVTCGQWQFCGDSACCQTELGNWICC